MSQWVIQWELHLYFQVVVANLADAFELLNMCRFHGKSNTGLSMLFAAVSTPKEGVVKASLCQLTFVCEALFAKGCDIDFVARH